MRFLLFAALLLACLAAAGKSQAQLALSPERPLGDAMPRRPISALHDADVAFGGGQHAIVWAALAGALPEIRLARVARDGTVLDSSGISLAPQGWSPHVGGSASGFYVAWTEDQPAQQGMYGRTVGADGVTLGPVTRLVGEDYLPGGAEVREVLGHGRYEVLWTEGGRTLSVRGVSADGVPDPRGSVHIADNIAGMGAACAGATCLVAWYAYDFVGVHAVRIGADGALLDPVPLVLDTELATAAPQVAAFDGASFACVWRATDGAGGSVARALRVGSDGTSLGTLGLDAWTTPSADVAVWPAAGGVLEVSTVGTGAATGTFIGSDGSPHSAPWPVSAFDAVDVADDGSSFAIVAHDGVVQGGTYGTSPLSAPTLVPVATRAILQAAPVLATSGHDVLAVWGEDGPFTGDGVWSLYVQRFAFDGSPVDPVPTRLATDGYAYELFAVWDGGRYLIEYSDPLDRHVVSWPDATTVEDEYGLVEAILVTCGGGRTLELSWDGARAIDATSGLGTLVPPDAHGAVPAGRRDVRGWRHVRRRARHEHG